jgi:hypothetical protein
LLQAYRNRHPAMWMDQRSRSLGVAEQYLASRPPAAQDISSMCCRLHPPVAALEPVDGVM